MRLRRQHTQRWVAGRAQRRPERPNLWRRSRQRISDGLYSGGERLGPGDILAQLSDKVSIGVHRPIGRVLVAAISLQIAALLLA